MTSPSMTINNFRPTSCQRQILLTTDRQVCRQFSYTKTRSLVQSETNVKYGRQTHPKWRRKDKVQLSASNCAVKQTPHLQLLQFVVDAKSFTIGSRWSRSNTRSDRSDPLFLVQKKRPGWMNSIREIAHVEQPAADWYRRLVSRSGQSSAANGSRPGHSK